MAKQQELAQITVSCTTEYPAYKLDQQEKCWGLVTLKASKYEPDESRRPKLDIVAVIDKSGSMSGEKLFLVKKSLNFLVKNLLERDRLSVITYDTNVTIEFGLLPMDKNNKKIAERKIEEIRSGTMTNLSGGLLQGLCLILDRGETKNDVASVLLFTDGLANQGIKNKAKIIQAMKDPKRYLQKTENEMLDIDMIQRYQSNSTPAVSCSSLSFGTALSPVTLQHAPKRSSFSRSLRKAVNFFTKPTQQQVPAQNVSGEPAKECKSVNVITEQNIAPQAPQVPQPTQALQQPTQALQEPTQDLQKPRQAHQQPTHVLLQPGDIAAVQWQSEQTLEQPDQYQPVSQQLDETLKQLAHVQQQAQSATQSTEAVQQPEQHPAQSVPLKSHEAVNKERKVIDASVYTFGFGRDHDPEVLKTISEAANGMYYFIEDEKQISESFGHCFGGLVSTLGQNINLNLELSDDITMDKMHTDQSYTSDDTKQKWMVHLGDMMSEEERDVLLNLNLPRSQSLTTSILKASIKYFCVVDSIYKRSEAEMSVNRSADAKYSPELANHAIDRQRNRILTTKATREALELADKGELQLARKKLREEIKRVKESLTKDDELCKVLVEDMEKSLVGLQGYDVYEQMGKKAQISMLQAHSYQRSNRTSECSPYRNVSQSDYMSKFK